MVERKRGGRIINISSVHEDMAMPTNAPYCAAKGGLRMLMRTVAVELALATGDAFLCASERQRDLYLGMLAELGRIDVDRYRSDPALRDMIDVVPFGLPDVPPEPGAPALKGVVPGIGQHDRVLVWGGGIWNWLDPLTPIRAVARLAQRRDDVKLVFLGRKHPQMPEMAMAATAVDLARRLRVLDRCVFFHDEWVPYAERGRYLLEADVGISAHFETVETRFAFRTRLLDYFWAGLPTVTTRGDVLGDLVEARRLGRAVDAGDADGWIEALGTLLDGVDEAARAKRAAQEVRAELAWPIVAEPLRRLAEQSGPKVRTSSWLLELEGLVEIRPAARIPPQPLLLRIALHQGDPLGGPAGEPEISERLVVDREDRGGGPELRAHVADRRSVRQGEAGERGDHHDLSPAEAESAKVVEKLPSPTHCTGAAPSVCGRP